MLMINCRNCKWWEPWKLPARKTLLKLNPRVTRGDCRNQASNEDATFSNTTCDKAEIKEKK